MTFHAGQKVWYTGGHYGDRKILAEVVEASGVALLVRIDGYHFWDKPRIEWPPGEEWYFYPDGTEGEGLPYIIPREDEEQSPAQDDAE